MQAGEIRCAIFLLGRPPGREAAHQHRALILRRVEFDGQIIHAKLGSALRRNGPRRLAVDFDRQLSGAGGAGPREPHLVPPFRDARYPPVNREHKHRMFRRLPIIDAREMISEAEFHSEGAALNPQPQSDLACCRQGEVPRRSAAAGGGGRDLFACPRVSSYRTIARSHNRLSR